MAAGATLEHRIDAIRLGRFVGREREIERFRAALTADDVAILYLFGPGGVGKSSLLDVFAREASARGRTVVRIDARDIDVTPQSMEQALAARHPPGQPDGERPLVLMLDTWELAASLDEWLRSDFLLRLPEDALVVLSSRNPPGSAWTTHRAWAPMLQVIGVRNFLPEESVDFLTRQGVPPERQAALAELTYGHPLALSLLCMLERDAPELAGSLAFRDRPDLVHALLERCLHTLPDGDERRALAVAAHTRVTTEDLLRDVLDLDDAGPFFTWLRGLSIMQEGPYGIFPHDLARDVIDAEFRWRDLAGYIALHERTRAPILRRIRAQSGIEQQHAANDLLYLHRNGPVMGRIHHWATFGQGRLDFAAEDDLPAILAMTERHEGAASAAIARYWWERPEAVFTVFRSGPDDVFGFNACLTLSEPDDESSAVDPAMTAMWSAIEGRAPLRPGEVARYDRFQMDRDAHHQPSRGTNLMAMCCLLHWVTTPNLAWSFMSITDPSHWDPVFTYLDHLSVADADFLVAGTHNAVYGHDWRLLPVEPWLTMMGTREIASEFPNVQPHAGSGTTHVLSRPDFEQAVRRALRDIHDSGALGRNPLASSRLVLGDETGVESPAEILRGRLLAAVDLLRQSPRDAKLYRAIVQTYLKPAGSQELAAELLGLPFNTYRYHLSGGIRRIVDELWRIELGD